MSKAHAKGAARPSQPETNLSIDPTMLHIAVLIGGGILPTHGEYTPAVWAKWTGMGEAYIERFFIEHDVPYRRMGGDLRFYDAAVVNPLLPSMTVETDPKRRHGGKRK